jgi:hypothetical protein
MRLVRRMQNLGTHETRHRQRAAKLVANRLQNAPLPIYAMSNALPDVLLAPQ